MDHHEIQGKIGPFQGRNQFFYLLQIYIGRDNFQRLKNSSIMSMNA